MDIHYCLGNKTGLWIGIGSGVGLVVLCAILVFGTCILCPGVRNRFYNCLSSKLLSHLYACKQLTNGVLEGGQSTRGSARSTNDERSKCNMHQY